MLNAEQILCAAQGYAESMLWANTEDERTAEFGTDLRTNDWGTWEEFPLRTQCEETVREFADMAGEYVHAYVRALATDQPEDYVQLGHDLALTRNHHGAGFWDRGAGISGDILTEHAHSLGEDIWTVQIPTGFEDSRPFEILPQDCLFQL